MLTNQERESLIKQQYWYLLVTVIVAMMHYYVLGFPFIKERLPTQFAEPLYKTWYFMMGNVAWLFNPWYILAILIIGLTFYGLGTKGVKSTTITAEQVRNTIILGLMTLMACACLLWFKPELFKKGLWVMLYTTVHFIAQMVLAKGATQYSRLFKNPMGEDLFNDEKETFPQEERLLESEFSVNIPTEYRHNKKVRNGWINVVNPFRAVMVAGIQGSGKTFSVLIPALEQHIVKGFCALVYDIKFPDMTRAALGALMTSKEVNNKYNTYELDPRVYIINFDDIERSHRCNPLAPEKMTDVLDAFELAQTLMFNINRTWIEKQGDFFADSAINFMTANIWVLKRIDDRRRKKYEQELKKWNQEANNSKPKPTPPASVCTFPHVIEFANTSYKKVFPILLNYPEVENYSRMFADALANGTLEQLDGQIATARNGIARLGSPTLYWVMTGNDFTLDINNPKDPKIVCLGNNPKRQNIYGAALSLYTSQMLPLINQKGKRKCALFIDELPTMYLKGLDQLIATGRSNLIATYMGIQDFSQLVRDYGQKPAAVIQNMVGTIFSGQLRGTNAEQLSKQFGKTNQKKVSVTHSKNDTTINESEQMQELIPASKISSLSQGTFVGSVADERGLEMPIKMFHAKLLVNPSKNSLPQVPIIYDFEQLKNSIPQEKDTPLEEFKSKFLFENLQKIKKEIAQLVEEEIERLPPDLRTAFAI
ncbi:type IV secretory system conjugative DNA transfer family protein [Xanthocytophaga flava]|uniref:type IV secretory system conjugative DNA transfer family protein n=1 Tax=Xanthocytophaga flava TaxID=3048013 RepID=UPI0028D15D69|nr:type IV secretory system conjugative DNA transfer family protein [Xanthocytophaga flavus]MDJ1470277.1 type IV secretory system conjugative DNA transfer family protein [Xanthocytophaga flavus]